MRKKAEGNVKKYIDLARRMFRHQEKGEEKEVDKLCNSLDITWEMLNPKEEEEVEEHLVSLIAENLRKVLRRRNGEMLAWLDEEEDEELC